MDKDKVKQDLEEIETINIELDHRVSKLIAENEHLKYRTYKHLYDSMLQPAVYKDSELILVGLLGGDSHAFRQTDSLTPMKMEILLEPTSNKLMEHLKMEMEIPCSNKIKFITACSFSNDSFEDIMKAQVSVIKASATLNIQAFKIKKSVSISFRMTQVHKMAKDHMMMIRDYDWMMISKKLKDHIQVKLKPKSLKFTTSDSQDTNQ
ncbi:hypothetical protein Tco_0179989 [Tanacetum coccineum]